MYIIEKCIHNNVNAAYDDTSRYHWVRAWSDQRGIIVNLDVERAIDTFHQETARVKSVPYRLRSLDNSVVLASLNCNDDEIYKKHLINAVEFTLVESITPSKPQTFDAEAPLRDIVHFIAAKLMEVVSSHNVTMRFNSNGQSGGAYLMTDPISGVMSNSDVGISYSSYTQCITLMVSNKFLRDDSFGDHTNPFTNKLDHRSVHDSVELAIDTLKDICKQTTPEEAQLLKAK